MSRSGSATNVTDRLEPARERLSSAAERARDGAEVARVRAREGAELARERAAEVAETVEPQARRGAAAVSRAGRTALQAGSLVPGLLSRVLALLATLTGGLAERGREVAARIEPPKTVRRRSKLRTAGWFVAGFGAGAATGWILRARTEEPAYDPQVGSTDVPPYGEEAAAIDARRENAPLR